MMLPPYPWLLRADVLAELRRIEDRTPGLALAIVLVAQHESGGDPSARGTVRDSSGRVLADPAGLLQWVPATARAYGVEGGAAAVVALGMLGQLRLAERYALGVLRGASPSGWRLWLAGWGDADPSPEVLYPAGSVGARANPAMQSPDGAIRVGTVERHWNAWSLRQPAPVDSAELERRALGKAPGEVGAADSSPPSRLLRLGSTGCDVCALRRALGLADGEMFDAETDAAVRVYQSASGLVVDGIVGPLTRAALEGAK